VRIREDTILSMGKATGMRIYLYGQEAGLGVEHGSPAKVFFAANSVFDFEAPKGTDRVRFDYSSESIDQDTHGIYYTGGLYYGIGVDVRGIPTDRDTDTIGYYLYRDDVGSYSRRIVYLRGERGLSGRVSAEVGYLGIADGGVTSAKIKNGEVKEADLAPDAVTSAKIKNGEVKTADIGDVQVTIPKLRYYCISYSMPAGGTTGPWKISDYIPVFWGRNTTTEREGWWMSDWSTRNDGTEWEIMNITSGDRAMKTIELSRCDLEGPKSGFFLVYDTKNGWIDSVVKAEDEGYKLLEPTSENYAFLPLDNHPKREEIFEDPSQYIVDLKNVMVRERTPTEKYEFEEWVKKAVEAGLLLEG
jgi:hypothetical protein